MAYSQPNPESGSGSSGLGISADLRPHAYDPIANPELFDGVLTRRFVAFVIDLIIIGLPVAAAALFILVFGLSPSALAGCCSGCFRRHPWCGHCSTMAPRSVARPRPTLGMRAMEIEMRTWYGAPAYFVLGAVHAIVYWVSVSLLTPFIVVVGFLNSRKRLLHDMLVGAVIINNNARAASLRGRGSELYDEMAFNVPAFSGNLPGRPG